MCIEGHILLYNYPLMERIHGSYVELDMTFCKSLEISEKGEWLNVI